MIPIRLDAMMLEGDGLIVQIHLRTAALFSPVIPDSNNFVLVEIPMCYSCFDHKI